MKILYVPAFNQISKWKEEDEPDRRPCGSCVLILTHVFGRASTVTLNINRVTSFVRESSQGGDTFDLNISEYNSASGVAFTSVGSAGSNRENNHDDRKRKHDKITEGRR